jgi:hypothetical protein
LPTDAVVRTAGVRFVPGFVAGVAIAVEANEPPAAKVLVVAGQAGVVGFTLADDGNVEGIAYRSVIGAGDCSGIGLFDAGAATMAVGGAVVVAFADAGAAPKRLLERLAGDCGALAGVDAEY